jgi:serine/threonine-protein kinase
MKKRTISHYDIVRKLGAGGSGIAYLANDTLLQRPVVLKVLKTGTQSVDEIRRTVLREARMASAIEHPNVCAIYEVGETATEAYIAMQYVPGHSLDNVIAEGPASLELVLSIGIQIADGLAAAHQLGIFHRDLKPANVMLTDGGLVKILDFGLARRLNPEDVSFDPAVRERQLRESSPATYTARGGTIAYMAPEQFVTGQSSAQSDIFAFGVILFELLSGRHPFQRADAEEMATIRAIQYADPPPLNELRPDIPPELISVVLRCLEKVPAERFRAAADVREALRTVMKTRDIGVEIPGQSSVSPIARPDDEEKRTTGLLSMLAERFRESTTEDTTHQTVLVLPFANVGPTEVPPLYGLALADAIGARLARMPSLIVRPSSSLMTIRAQDLDPLAVGQKLMVQYVLAGSFLRGEQGFDLNWQLLEIKTQSVRSGGTIRVPSFDLVAVQTEISNEVFGSLQGVGTLDTSAAPERSPRLAALAESASEEYLRARAVLSSFMSRTSSRTDLDLARELFDSVIAKDDSFAAAYSGLGITHLQYVRHGYGGQVHVLAARRAFDRALELDPGSVEANLYRVYMLLSRGEKESARHGIEHLLRTAANDWNVHLVAGIALRTDGIYEAALNEFNTSLRLNPSNAAVVYNHRARVYQYQNQLELAAEEIEKGLTLEPRHPLLRTSRAYQLMREGKLADAITTLEQVIADDTSMRIAYPTLALCYAQAGDRRKAATLIVEDTLSAAEADAEMAYRLATYFAVDGDESEALHWLRRAIYLGNENYPWFTKNPAWAGLQPLEDFQRILEDLKKKFRRNQKTWKRLLEGLPEV